MSTTAPTIDPTPTITTIADHVTLTVEAWHDPIVEAAPGAVRTDTDDALVWYTPSIGTIGIAMAHRFARHATDGPSLWTIEDLALTFGIGNSAARVWRSLDRLDRFGTIVLHPLEAERDDRTVAAYFHELLAQIRNRRAVVHHRHRFRHIAVP